MYDAIDIIDKLFKRLTLEAPQYLPVNCFNILEHLRKTLEDFEKYRDIYQSLMYLSERKGSIVYDLSPIDDGLNYKVICGDYRFRSASISAAFMAIGHKIKKEKK